MAEFLIEALGAAGDGVCGEVFVPFTLPGERVQGVVVDGRVATPTIASPSRHRVDPDCPHFGDCGGCALQHASDAFVAGWKRDRIAEALAARGIVGVDIRQTMTSPPRSRRRATFAARRTKKTIEIGFHARAADRIVAIDTCVVLDPALMAALPAIAAAARLGASRKGAVRACATASEAGVDLAIEDAKPIGDRFAEIAALAEQHDLARLSWNGDVAALRRPPGRRFGAAMVVPTPGGFLQATREGEAALQSAVAEAAAGARRVVDLFAGCGALSLPLAGAATVHAVESDAGAIAALLEGWRRAAGLKQVSGEVRDLFRRPLLGSELAAYDAAVIDPPRAGAAAQSAQLAERGPSRIAAISCNPATFARDARTLIDGGYALDWITPVDQFRWSPHVELAAAFSRR